MHITTQSRAIMATLAAVLALSAVDMRPVAAASAAPQGAEAAKRVQASDATEFSSQRRGYHGGYRHSGYRHGGYRYGGAVAAGAILGAAAVGLAARPYYGYGYGYAEPYAYAPAPYYAPSYYGPRDEYFPN